MKTKRILFYAVLALICVMQVSCAQAPVASPEISNTPPPLEVPSNSPDFNPELTEPLITKAPVAIKGVYSGSMCYTNYLLASDGSVWAWGNGYKDSPEKVIDNVKHVSANMSTLFAIKNDGSLWQTSGLTSDGTNIIKEGLQKVAENVKDATAIDSMKHFIVLDDGTLWLWQLDEPAKKLLDGVKAVDGGGYHVLALKDNGSLWAWGSNMSGAIGDGTQNDRSKFVKVLNNVKAMATGVGFSLAVKSDGTLWAWGGNHSGELSDQYKGGGYICRKPFQVMDEVKVIDAGRDYVIALKEDGSLWTWGENNYGQLGDGTEKKRSKPKKILDDVESITAGARSAFAIKTDGSVWAWGCGPLGNGEVQGSLTPIKVLDGSMLNQTNS